MTAFRDQFDCGPASEPPHEGTLPAQNPHEPSARLQLDGAERERLEALIRDQRRELERLHRVALLHGVVAGLVHKLNQPLACVQLTLASCINRAMTGELTGGDAVTELSDAMAQIRSAVSIMRRGSDFVAHHSPGVRPLDIKAEIEDLLGLVGVEAGLQGISLACDIPPDLPAVGADRIHVAQVVLDLICCAADAIKGDETVQRMIRIEVESGENSVLVRVLVESTALPAVQLRKRLEERLDATDVSTLPGLSLSQGIIGEYGDRIRAEDRGDGAAGFVFALPLARITAA